MNFQAGLIAGGVVGRTVGKRRGLTLTRRARRLAAKKEATPIVMAFAAKFGVHPDDWTDAHYAEAAPSIHKIAEKWGVRVDEF